MTQETTQTDAAFEAQLKEQVAALLALSVEQRKAIVDACTMVIDTITDKGSLVLLARKDVGEQYALRTAGWGCDGPEDVAELLAYAATGIAKELTDTAQGVLQ